MSNSSCRQGGPNARPALRVSKQLLTETFGQFRSCGQGRRECQVLWIGPWSTPDIVTEIVHPRHSGLGDGFILDDAWITVFWVELAERGYGIRAQVHTHPRRAFHSETDDEWPIVHLAGFLSLVVPDFAQGSIGLDHSYLAEIGETGRFSSVDPKIRLDLV